MIAELMALVAGPRKAFGFLKQALLVLTLLLVLVAINLVGLALFGP